MGGPWWDRRVGGGTVSVLYCRYFHIEYVCADILLEVTQTLYRSKFEMYRHYTLGAKIPPKMNQIYKGADILSQILALKPGVHFTWGEGQDTGPRDTWNLHPELFGN